MKSKVLHVVLVILLAISVLFQVLPGTYVSAKPKSHHQDKKPKKPKKEPPKEKKPDKYLVLIGQGNGTYKAYDDIAFLTSKDKVMVKAELLAEVLGLTYESSTGFWLTKGCSLGLNNRKNIYTRNQKTYYVYDYSKNSRHPSIKMHTAAYKHIVHQNYNAVHCATLSTLVNYKYFDTTKVKDYSTRNYAGVVVYSKYASATKLPALSSIVNWNDKNTKPDSPKPGDTISITVTPSTYQNGDVKLVEASYYISQSDKALSLDLTSVLSAFKAIGLLSDGIYGYGSCDTAVTIEAFNSSGHSLGSIKTSGDEFGISFPGASKLLITGKPKNLTLDFTPVMPIAITTDMKLSFSQIPWVYGADGYPRQYFVLSGYMRIRLENVSASYVLQRKILSQINYSDPDYANAYQRVTFVLKGGYEEAYSSNRYLDIAKTKKSLSNSLYIFTDTGNATLAQNYESQLISMITSIKTTGSKVYYPSANFDRQLVMKLSDKTENKDYSYIMLEPSSLDLNIFHDYYLHLHEMAHFYEATKPHYGFRFEAWRDGSAVTLAKKTMDNLKISYKDSQGIDFFDSIYSTNYSFLTPEDKKNFEAYYLNATGVNATIIGYQFTKFLQDTYGSDIIYKIMEKVYSSNIPTNAGRNSTYDKQFTDCIKAVTSPKVFQLFVEYCIE